MEGPTLLFSLFFLTFSSISGFKLQAFSPSSLTQIQSQTTTVPQPPIPSSSLPLIPADSFQLTKPPHELLRLRLGRDALRVLEISARQNRSDPLLLNSTIYSGYLQGSCEFFTRIRVGTPARAVQLVVDTGSDLTWIQCYPCRRCYKQTDPHVFVPARSKSFSLLPCNSHICKLQNTHGCTKNRKCTYGVSYGDGSYTKGGLATETLTFHKTRLARVAMGCGHQNEGLFSGAAGLFGLGRGKVSFVAQKGYRFNRTFSYCLVSLFSTNSSSWLLFGKHAVSRKATFTPMVNTRTDSAFYTVRLTGISVGEAPVDLPAATEVIVDSGTCVTRLEQKVYEALRDAFRARNPHLKRADSPIPELLDTCYHLSGVQSVNVTTVALEFEGGARMDLAVLNLLFPVDNEGTFCFTFARTTGPSILGNLQQQGFRVVFDLDRKLIGFASDSCLAST